MRSLVRWFSWLLVTLLLCSLLPDSPAYADPLEETSRPTLADALNQAIADTLGAPGVTAYVGIPGMEPWSGSAGMANLAAGIAMQPDAQLRIGSVTKLFISTIALQLVQEGWLRLDQNVEQWLPGLLPNGAQINIQMLLQHRSGLPDYLTDAFVERALSTPERIWAPQELVVQGLGRPGGFTPGARWSYSNTNYIVLGLIIERVTNNSLAAELQQRIIMPLGLQHTELAAPSADTGDIARGYEKGQDYTALNMSVAWAAGGINASAADLGRFSQALFWGELLDQEHLALIQQFRSTGGWGGADLVYGLGLMRRTLPANGVSAEARVALGHTGALCGYRSSFWYLPQSGITIVVLVNRYETEPNRFVSRILEVLADYDVIS